MQMVKQKRVIVSLVGKSSAFSVYLFVQSVMLVFRGKSVQIHQRVIRLIREIVKL